MKFRYLGNSGLKVSEICYGNWLTHGSQVENETATKCVRAALDAGITSFDTADVYANTVAEKVLGDALKGERRESEREVHAATSRRDAITAQLTNVRQMLATLGGAAIVNPLAEPDEPQNQPESEAQPEADADTDEADAEAEAMVEQEAKQ